MPCVVCLKDDASKLAECSWCLLPAHAECAKRFATFLTASGHALPMHGCSAAMHCFLSRPICDACRLLN